MFEGMELALIHQCLSDATRLRMLNLLASGPLCVCHLQEILDEPQVKVSRHLAYLKTRGLVEVRREGTWRHYSLPKRSDAQVKAILACLCDCASRDPKLRADLKALAVLQRRLAAGSGCC